MTSFRLLEGEVDQGPDGFEEFFFVADLPLDDGSHFENMYAGAGKDGTARVVYNFHNLDTVIANIQTQANGVALDQPHDFIFDLKQSALLD